MISGSCPSSPQEAIALDPKNPLARFERAAVLMSLDMPDQVRVGGMSQHAGAGVIGGVPMIFYQSYQVLQPTHGSDCISITAPFPCFCPSG